MALFRRLAVALAGFAVTLAAATIVLQPHATGAPLGTVGPVVERNRFASVTYTFRRPQAGVVRTVRLSLCKTRRYVGMALLLRADLAQDANIDAVRSRSYKLLQGLAVSASDC